MMYARAEGIRGTDGGKEVMEKREEKENRTRDAIREDKEEVGERQR